MGKCLKIKGSVVISYNDDENICKALSIKNILVDYNYEKIFLLGNVVQLFYNECKSLFVLDDKIDKISLWCGGCRYA